MQAVILAGGRGQRLRPITDYVPKALTPLANIPLLEWQLRYLNAFGITNVIVCSGYKSDMIEHFLERRGLHGVTVSVEKQPLGTAGAIKNASSMIRDSEFLVMNGDIITDMDINKIPLNGIAAVPLRTKFGILSIRNDHIVEFGEKTNIPDKWINAGLYVLDHNTLDQLPARGDIETTLFPKWAGSGILKVRTFPDSQWYSIDSFKDISECSAVIKNIIK